MNSVTLIGRLVRDNETKTIGTNNTMVLRNVLAVDRAGARDDDNKYKSGFFDIEVWEKQAEIMENYTKKGSKIGVTGALKHETWEKDGVKGSRVSIRVNQVELLDPKDGGGGAPAGEATPVAAGAAAAEENPFA